MSARKHKRVLLHEQKVLRAQGTNICCTLGTNIDAHSLHTTVTLLLQVQYANNNCILLSHSCKQWWSCLCLQLLAQLLQDDTASHHCCTDHVTPLLHRPRESFLTLYNTLWLRSTNTGSYSYNYVCEQLLWLYGRPLAHALVHWVCSS